MDSKYSSITHEDIIRAIEVYNNSNNKATFRNYCLVYEGHNYPSKEIIRIAYNLKNNSNITSNDLSGGKQWIRFYEERGFVIKVLNEEIVTDTSVSETEHIQERGTTIERSQNINDSSERQVTNNKQLIKVGCYLQTLDLINSGFLNDSSLENLKSINCDIIVFPEFTEYEPFKSKAYISDIFNTTDLNSLFEIGLLLSQKIDKAVMICNHDRNDVIFAIYAYYSASSSETRKKVYVKSSFDKTSLIYKRKDYSNMLSYLSEYDLIDFKNYKIGMTICADCNDRLYSAMYKNVDIILNGTGGFVNHKKWYIHNKARSIENNAFVFTTMGCQNNKDNVKGKNYTFGFDRLGNSLNSDNYIFTPDKGGVYVYNVANSSCEPTNDYDNLDINDGFDYSLNLNTYASNSSKSKNLGFGTLYINNDGIIVCEINSTNIFNNKNTMIMLHEAACLKKKEKAKTVIVINRWNDDQNINVTLIKYILMSLSISAFCVTVFLGKDVFCYQPCNRIKNVVSKPIIGDSINVKLEFASFNLFNNHNEFKNVELLIKKL